MESTEDKNREWFNISEYGAWFIGVIAAMLTAVALFSIVGDDLNKRNADGAEEKTEQIKSCVKLEDEVAGLVCILEMEK